MQIKICSSFRFPSFPKNRHFGNIKCSRRGDSLRHLLRALLLAMGTFGLIRRFPIKCRRVSMLLKHNMAKSLQLFAIVIAVLNAGIFPTESSTQRQICTYFGMNHLFYSYLCYPAIVSFVRCEFV